MQFKLGDKITGILTKHHGPRRYQIQGTYAGVSDKYPDVHRIICEDELFYCLPNTFELDHGQRLIWPDPPEIHSV